MTETPLGIADLYATTTQHWPDHWYWCRRHEQSRQPGMKCSDGNPHPGLVHHFPLDSCIRIGPFMTEREANRCDALGYVPTEGPRKPLGMEVEC